MAICYVLGGLGESTLCRSPQGAAVVWPDPTVMMLGKLGELRLAPNGTEPGEPDGVALYPVGVPGPYVGFPATILGAQLAFHGYSTRLYSWDWRKAVYPAGVAFAGHIRAEVSPSDPCTIVAHSAGGLVARAAWTDLGTTGDQGLVRRIVTLGTPHWGSYAIVKFWSGQSETIDLLNYWNQQVGYNTAGYAPSLTGYQYLNTLDYQRLALTWPGFYDTLPVLGQPGAEADVYRPALYDAANWPAAARPQQAWLDWSRDHTGPWLRSAASQPPAHVLTCVSGYGTPVESQLEDVAQLGRAGAVGTDAPGDNSVTQAAAELAQAVVESWGVDHENWLPTLANSGDLARLVTAERSPGPLPPPVVILAPQTTNVQPLPFPDGLAAGAPSQLCSGGACVC